MARMERREIERWPEAQHEENWQQESESEERWPEADAEGRWAETPQPGRRRTGRLRVEIPPIVNPYAIVALVAALLGLFPVAIVFGFIAFSHPRGKAMAVSALLIGVAEATALAGFVVLSGTAWTDSVSRANKVAEVSTVAAPPVVVTTVAPTTVAPPPVTTTSAATNLVTPKKGTACSDPALIGTGADGNTLLCLATPASGGYQWAGPYTIATAVQQAGTKCEVSGTTKSARTADGHALACESKVWAMWTE
ncbi:DUF4190 domain-containing protein [Nocardia sp. NBC_01009]|uniref:DUF4190 domain-containing protein n=1 Tax=Nocardia sp. NBC_01009 TaxID=2975996 RepID=UPI0038660F55|nr:DUF4190 domain-containing protein [Nocardia sp. NBC_01009]